MRVTRDGVSIRTHDTAGLFATLSNHHINTRGAQVHEGRLENVYLQLTGKDHVD
ncbi:ABC transporter [Cutibacterium acnes JCM 18916]|nr:ABC transporter [Cutibacterium acnes JCM 18916]